MTRPNTDHVTMQDVTADVALMQCNNCGEQHCPQLPMPATLLADRLLGFVRMHRLCPKPVPPSPQLALPGTDLQREIEAQEIAADGGNGSMCSTDERERCDLCRQWVRDIAGHRCGEVDASTSDPAPEIDPPGPPARHGEGELLDAIELRHLITCVRPREFWPAVKQVETWHTDVRADVQRWCRIEVAHAHPIAGHPLPPREPMPNVLANLGHAPKEKRGARPLTSPKKKGKTVQP